MRPGYSLKCALASTAIFSAIKIANFLSHTQFSGVGIYSGLIALALTIIPLYAGIKHKRDHEFGGFISIRQVWITGIIISVQAGILIAIYTFIHYSFIDTEVIPHWVMEAKRLGLQEKKSQPEIQEAIDMLTRFYSPFKQATVASLGILGTGALFSFILSTFMVKTGDVNN
jgi:Protein of unknown function (DUF4199)